MFSGRILFSPEYRPNQSADNAPHQTKHPIKRQLFAPSRLCAKLYPKIPHQQPSEPEHTNPKTFVEIFDSVEQKPFPLTPSFPSINQTPTNSQSNTEHPNPKKRAFSEICPRKNLPLQLSH
jgi:hypothetical protein